DGHATGVQTCALPIYPDGMAYAAEAPQHRRRRLTRADVAQGSVPYGLILPVVVVLGALLAYPIYRLVVLSLQKYTLFELIQHKRSEERRVGRGEGECW